MRERIQEEIQFRGAENKQVGIVPEKISHRSPVSRGSGEQTTMDY
jgi:hypothetical protein